MCICTNICTNIYTNTEISQVCHARCIIFSSTQTYIYPPLAHPIRPPARLTNHLPTHPLLHSPHAPTPPLTPRTHSSTHPTHLVSTTVLMLVCGSTSLVITLTEAASSDPAAWLPSLRSVTRPALPPSTTSVQGWSDMEWAPNATPNHTEALPT